MPKDNIERAIAKGTGEGADADALESVLDQGYGPGGVALLIEALTEYRGCTCADVRHLLSKHGGNLGEPGSVSYLFDKLGRGRRRRQPTNEDDLIPAIDAGAEDIEGRRRRLRGAHHPADLAAVRAALEEAGVEIQTAEVAGAQEPRRGRRVAGSGKLMRLIEALEDNDDVGAVHANFDVDAAVLERVAG